MHEDLEPDVTTLIALTERGGSKKFGKMQRLTEDRTSLQTVLEEDNKASTWFVLDAPVSVEGQSAALTTISVRRSKASRRRRKCGRRTPLLPCAKTSPPLYKTISEGRNEAEVRVDSLYACEEVLYWFAVRAIDDFGSTYLNMAHPSTLTWWTTSAHCPAPQARQITPAEDPARRTLPHFGIPAIAQGSDQCGKHQAALSGLGSGVHHWCPSREHDCMPWLRTGSFPRLDGRDS